MSESIGRRKFLRQTGITGLSVAASLQGIRGRAAPNDRVTMAVIGVNSRGNALTRYFSGLDGSEVAYVCDVDERAVRKAQDTAEKIQGKRPKGETDLRRLLESKDFDAVAIATPDHWHAPAAILAVQAGKHVYVEKPCSHNPREGELLVKAERKYNRVIQMGNQRRSFKNAIEAMDLIHSGEIGPVRYVRSWYFRDRGPINSGKKIPIPQWLDWELWQGPAPREDYRDNLVHYDWHWFWHWGTGESGNNGVHTLDVARWGLQVDFPKRVTAAGGRYFHEHWESPDTQNITFEFEGDKMITWEGISSGRLRTFAGAPVGLFFEGEKGFVVFPEGNHYQVYDRSGKLLNEVKEKERSDGPLDRSMASHIENFLDSIRGLQKPNSPMTEAHKSTLLCHLGNIAHRVNRPLHCDPLNGRIKHDNDAMAFWSRRYEKSWEPKV